PTAATGLVDERALAAVAFVELAADCGRNVPGFGLFWSRVRSWLAAGGEAFFLDALDQHVERSLEDRRDVSVWNAMTQQILRRPQLVPEQVARRELNFVRILRERPNDRRWRQR